MDYFELAKNLVRMNEDWRQHGHVRSSEIERLPKTHLSLLLRALRPQDKGISGDAGVSILLRRIQSH